MSRTPAVSSWRRGCWWVVVGLMTFPGLLAGQEGCEAVAPGNDVVNTQTIPGIGRVTYITRPHFLCQGGVEIFADSAIAYEASGMSDLIGAVRYLQGGREMLADEARYFTNEGRLQAEGNLTVSDPGQGSSIENGDLVYLLQTDFRDEETMTVTIGQDGMRPIAVLTPPPPDRAATPDSVEAPDSAEAPGEPAEPYTVVSDRIVLKGAEYFAAAGNVEIVRDSLFAFADSAEYDQVGGGLILEGGARVETETYDLRGRTITLGTPGSASSEIRALRDAELNGDDLLLTSAQILLFLTDGSLERLVATPIRPVDGLAVVDSVDLTTPKAVLGDFVLSADSLEVSAPGEVLQRVFAAGQARSESTSRDTLNVGSLPDVAQTDWLEGDTVVVYFAPRSEAAEAAEADEAPQLEVDSIVALVRARSLYRLEPSDSSARAGVDPPAVHYVVGDEIHIAMASGQVVGMNVVGQTRGVHLEPLTRIRAPADTTALPDTAAVPDTSGFARAFAGAGPKSVQPGTRSESLAVRRHLTRSEPPKNEETPWTRR